MGLQAGGNSSALTIDIGVPAPVQNILALDRSVQTSGLSTPLYGTFLLYSSDGSVSILVSSITVNRRLLSNRQLCYPI